MPRRRDGLGRPKKDQPGEPGEPATASLAAEDAKASKARAKASAKAEAKVGAKAAAKDAKATSRAKKATDHADRAAAKSAKTGRPLPIPIARHTFSRPSDFGVLIHPIDLDDVVARSLVAEKVNARVLTEFMKIWPPFLLSEITGVRSRATGREISGVIGVLPLLPLQFNELADSSLCDKVIAGCKACAKQGAKIIGLGAMTAMPGRGGRTVAEYMRAAVTTGNTYTVATAIRATRMAAEEMGIDRAHATLAILDAASPTGRAAAMLLGPEFGRVLLIGRSRTQLSNVAAQMDAVSSPAIELRTDIVTAVREAQVVVVGSGKLSTLIAPDDIAAGGVVCDVVRPRQLSDRVRAARSDVLSIDGGVVRVPGEMDLGMDLGLGPGLALACMAEPMILALEERYVDYTLGQEVSVERVREIEALADKHGFEVVGFRTFDREYGAPQRPKPVKKLMRTLKPTTTRIAKRLGRDPGTSA
jgi:fatty aldehyde-generating acyl-ACP reductase